MVTKQMTKVYSVNSTLHAVAVQNTLECAGITVSIQHSVDGYDLMVPAAQAVEANELLHPQPRSGEIYFIPSQPVYLNWARA